MSTLYSDILASEIGCETGDVSLAPDGTWTIRSWYANDVEIPGFPSEDMAKAVVRALCAAYDHGADSAGYS